MVKSRAEICRDYRRRLKEKDNEGYLRRERERRRKNYVPSEKLSKSQRAERQAKGRAAVRRHRERYRRQDENEEESNAADTSGYESMSSENHNSNMIVAMRFPNRSAGPRTRIRNDLNKAKQTITDLKLENIELARKLKSEQKKRQRIVKRLQRSPQTPRSMTESLMNTVCLTETQKKTVRKEILFGKLVAEQIKEKKTEHTKSTVRQLHMIVAGKIVRKYRFNRMLCSNTGLNKSTASKYLKASESQQDQSKDKISRRHEAAIIEFLERDDNSRVQPGKRDTVKCSGEEKQVRVLTDYLMNLHMKFLSENPNMKVSLATFCRVRPRYVQLSAFISRSSCLCTRHQNMALTARTLRGAGITVSANPDVFAKSDTNLEGFADKLGDTVNVPQWKRVDVEERGKKKSVMRIVDSEMSKEGFLSHVEKQREDFIGHVERIKNQYMQIRQLKENLPDNEVIAQMDFAENYACRTSEEIQSAYFNQTCVTLHPTVIYFKDQGELKHRSIVIISDTLAHNATTVATFLDTIGTEVKKIVPNVEKCHYWTDSPTSQYRNKLIFDIVAHHRSHLGYNAVWNYFEAGHGKGPCDGLGGSVKRMADNAIKTGKTMIQDEKEFFKWASESSTFANVTFRFVPDTDISAKATSIIELQSLLRPVKGTMKLHAVAGNDRSELHVRDVSCYCSKCIEGYLCASWRHEKTRKGEHMAHGTVNNGEDRDRNTEVNCVQTDTTAMTPTVVEGDYVCAVYDEHWYIGKVTDIDDDDNEIEISFMQKKKNLFQWPRNEDVIWIAKNNILCTISAPVETGKSKRMFRMSDSDESRIVELYSARQ